MESLLYPQVNSERNCLLILCPGCDALMAKCKFLYHCENECSKDEMKCINYTLGCIEVLTRLSMQHHLNYACTYRIKNICSCNELPVVNSIYDEVFSSQCLEHCWKCISNNCQEKGCQIIECINKCGMKMHTCKLKEHTADICCKSIVQCINKCYGCNVSMFRSERGHHLQWCLASIVQCGVEWSRDVAGCKIYQRYMDEGGGIWIQRKKRRLIHLGDKTIDRAFSVGMSLRDEIYLCVSLNESDICPLTADLYCSTGTVISDTQECFSVLGRPTTDIGNNRRSSLSQFMKGSMLSNSDGMHGSCAADSDIGDDCVSDGDLWSSQHAESNLKTEDSWRLCHMSKSHLSTSPGTFTFQCGQAVPRAEYSDHYRQHCDLSCQMDDWVEMSCPFASLGCSFTAMRLSPARSMLVYHPRSNYYGVRYHDPCTYLPLKSQSSISLLQLPLEVLIRVCGFLDGCSLLHASNSHPRLLQAIEMLMGGYYIGLRWFLTEHHTWRSRPQRFLPYSRGSASAVRGLVFTENSVGVITNHMSQCSFRGPLSLGPDTPPFCLHSLAADLPDTLLPEFLRDTSRVH